MHLTQLRRYEGGFALPTFEILRKLAVALSVSADALLFDEEERGPDDDLRLQFEAATRLDPDEKRLVPRAYDVQVAGVLNVPTNRRHSATNGVDKDDDPQNDDEDDREHDELPKRPLPNALLDGVVGPVQQVGDGTPPFLRIGDRRYCRPPTAITATGRSR